MAMFDLCATTDVRSFLQKEAADSGQDTEIGVLITAASRAIMRYTQREFAPSSSTGVVRKLAYRKFGIMSLAPWDLQAATLVQVDTDTSPITLTAGVDYILEPIGSPDGVYEWVDFPLLYPIKPATPSSAREVSITGTWGFPSIPEDVKQAAVATVATWLRRDVAAFSTTFVMDESRLDRPEALPSQVARMLAPWRRMVA